MLPFLEEKLQPREDRVVRDGAQESGAATIEDTKNPGGGAIKTPDAGTESVAAGTFARPMTTGSVFNTELRESSVLKAPMEALGCSEMTIELRERDR
ncbi:hypothetical protein OIU77_006893 [Salix suchowensis]|uniref:Uncharacterized protein n=1 Tax=Salix suchowensis TaxID=1278906 RepID=A0ABQ9ANN2_9ROSI|nr:hypothetical protein OIU77_006893 [Salix suchowensis]